MEIVGATAPVRDLGKGVNIKDILERGERQEDKDSYVDTRSLLRRGCMSSLSFLQQLDLL